MSTIDNLIKAAKLYAERAEELGAFDQFEAIYEENKDLVKEVGERGLRQVLAAVGLSKDLYKIDVAVVSQMSTDALLDMDEAQIASYRKRQLAHVRQRNQLYDVMKQLAPAVARAVLLLLGLGG